MLDHLKLHISSNTETSEPRWHLLLWQTCHMTSSSVTGNFDENSHQGTLSSWKRGGFPPSLRHLRNVVWNGPSSDGCGVWPYRLWGWAHQPWAKNRSVWRHHRDTYHHGAFHELVMYRMSWWDVILRYLTFMRVVFPAPLGPTSAIRDSKSIPKSNFLYSGFCPG